MRCTWLGWAGVMLQADGERILIDPLWDARALYAAAGPAAADVRLPEVVEPSGLGRAAGALITHLHRDHADAGALAAGLIPGAPVYIPAPAPGASPASDAGIAQARRELTESGLRVVELMAWDEIRIGPFDVTAVPAVDGTGEAQLSWGVGAGGHRIIHCGDTLFHGWWWRAAQQAGPFEAAFLPINGAVLNFPWRQPPSPLPGAMTPVEAVVAAHVLAVDRAVPIHYGGFDLDPFYRSLPGALDAFSSAAEQQGVAAWPLAVGATLDLATAP